MLLFLIRHLFLNIDKCATFVVQHEDPFMLCAEGSSVYLLMSLGGTCGLVKYLFSTHEFSVTFDCYIVQNLLLLPMLPEYVKAQSHRHVFSANYSYVCSSNIKPGYDHSPTQIVELAALVSCFDPCGSRGSLAS